MEIKNLPQEIVAEIEGRNEESDLIKLAVKLLDTGDRNNAAKILDMVFTR